MSTNYYIAFEGSNHEGEHIGLYSGGWTFMFQGMEHKTLEAWRHRLDNLVDGEHIFAESGYKLTPTEFWEMVEASKTFGGHPAKTHRPFSRDTMNWSEDGFSFSNYVFF